MGRDSGIAWTDDTFNPWIGCTKVGPGCDNCYAEAQDGHRKWTPEGWGAGKPRKRTTASWKNPVKWNREAEASGIRRRVFCASLADVFDNEIDPSWRDDLFALIRETPMIDWILLTKRIGNVPKMLPDDWGNGYPNVWLCISTVTQAELDRDWPKLAAVPATVRGLSIEPQLEFVDITRASPDWIISGAESGPNRRYYSEAWPRLLRDQCYDRGIAFFYKQIIRDGKKIETPELDGRIWAEFPRSETSVKAGGQPDDG